MPMKPPPRAVRRVQSGPEQSGSLLPGQVPTETLALPCAEAAGSDVARSNGLSGPHAAGFA